MKDVQRFLGLAGYYHRFVRGFADLVLPMSQLVQGEQTWQWTDSEERAFTEVKARLISAPVLRLPDLSLPFIVTTHASKYCVSHVV